MTGWIVMAAKGNIALGLEKLWYNKEFDEWARSMETVENGTWVPIPLDRVQYWKKRFGYETNTKEAKQETRESARETPTTRG